MSKRLTKKRYVNKSQVKVNASTVKRRLTKKHKNHKNRKSQTKKTKLYKVHKGGKNVKGKKTVQKGGLICTNKTTYAHQLECFSTKLRTELETRGMGIRAKTDTSPEETNLLQIHPFDNLICKFYIDYLLNERNLHNTTTYSAEEKCYKSRNSNGKLELVITEYNFILNLLNLKPETFFKMSAGGLNFYEWIATYYMFLFDDETPERQRDIFNFITRQVMFDVVKPDCYRPYQDTDLNELNDRLYRSHSSRIQPLIKLITMFPEEQVVSKKTFSKQGAMKKTNKTFQHIWYNIWPDMGVPEPTQFAEFIDYIYKHMTDCKGGNTLIHCSAGIGRTGVVYIVLKIYIDQQNSRLKYLQPIPITEEYIQIEIENARKHREGLVQTQDQYNFICTYFKINHTLNFSLFNGNPKEPYGKCNDISIEDINIIGNLPENNLPDPSSPTINRYTKNRYINIIPCETHRVKVPDVNYINASNMEPLYFAYEDSNKEIQNSSMDIVAAQGPLSQTTEDFYKLLKDKSIKRIIMVTGLVEKKMVKCADYFGNNDKQVKQVKLWGEIRTSINYGTLQYPPIIKLL